MCAFIQLTTRLDTMGCAEYGYCLKPSPLNLHVDVRIWNQLDVCKQLI